MMKKLKKMKENKKGFTLVELIVVLVILAILAAMLVPALLGYIDRAREGKYNEEIHSIYTAMQVMEDEAYAQKPGQHANFAGTANDYAKIDAIVSPTDVTKLEDIAYKTGNAAYSDANKHEFHTVTGFKVTFVSQDGNTVVATMDTATSEITVSSVTAPNP